MMSNVTTIPLVSIIVRTKDRPKLLKKALQSIAAQTYRPLEVILVNDGGCDLDMDELRTILGDVSLNYIRLEKNAGRANAGNVGIENAKGRYVGFLDDDDEFYPEHVDILVSFLEQSDYEVAYTDSMVVYKEYNPLTQEIINASAKLMYSEDFDFDKLIIDNYIPFMCLLFNREILLNSFRINTSFELYEDWDLLIRIGEKYPFYHIKKTTANYNQWCSASQISQRNKDKDFLKGSYLKLYSSHIDKFNPNRIYNFIRVNREQGIHIGNLEVSLREKDRHIGNLEMSLRGKDRHIGNLEISLKEKDVRIGNLDALDNEKDIHVENLKDVIKGKDQYIAGINFQFGQKSRHLETEIAKKDQYIGELESAEKYKDSIIKGIYSSHGWKALSAYYKIRDKILPPDSLRRLLIKSGFKFVRLIPKYLKKTTRPVNGKLIYQVETDLSKPFIVGAGNVLYLHGWCYHTSQRIRRLYIFVDNVEHPVSNFSFVRHDLYQAHFRKIDNTGNSLNSGFWVMLPFARIDSRHKVNLDICAELDSGEVCRSSLGALALEPAMNNMCGDNARDVPAADPEVAICMATYNPSIEYFRKQINSIVRQTYKNWRCIINDDCSKPEIFEKIKEITAADGRFKIYRNPTNLGFYYNFERCLSCVPEKVSFIALADQDDYWHEDKLSVLLNHFDGETFLVYSDMNIVDKDGETIHPTYWTTRKNNFTDLYLLLVANTVTGAASIFRRGLLEFLLPFPERIGDSYHDNFIACVALSLGKVKYVDSALYDYRQHQGNIIGHCVKEERSLRERLSGFPRKIKTLLMIGECSGKIDMAIKHYQALYYNHYPWRILLAQVLGLRCSGYVSREKRKVIKRFIGFEKSVGQLFLQVIKNKMLRNASVTLDIDYLLLKSVIINKLAKTYYRVSKDFHIAAKGR